MYVDSICSHNMSSDRRNFHFLNKTKDGHVVFEGSESLECWEVVKPILVRREKMQNIFGTLKV